MQTNKIAMLNHNTFAGVRSCESPIKLSKGASARSAGPLRPNCQMSILALVCSLRVLGTATAGMAIHRVSSSSRVRVEFELTFELTFELAHARSIFSFLALWKKI